MDQKFPFPIFRGVMLIFNFLFPAIYHTIISQKTIVSPTWSSSPGFPGK